MVQVFIDGKEGTTGLRIFDRLAGRKDIALLTLKEEQRKERSARKEMLNSCDIAFLCLPDAAAQEAVALIEKYRDDTRGTLFPVIPYQALKWCLTSIKMKAGIKGRLSYHMGRHNKNCIFQAMR